MKYAVHIDIDRPIKEVVEKFDNPNNLKKWMEGFQSIEPISGPPGQVGSKSKIVFQMGKRRMEMQETILTRNLPHELAFVYNVNGMNNIVRNKFESLGENKTRVINDQEFQFKGFMKVMGWLIPGVFKKQSMKYLVAFKKFVESE